MAKRNWVRMRTDLHNDPAVIAMADALGLDEDAVVGKLLRVWGWATEQLPDGNAKGNGVSVTKKFLDRLVFVTGFADAMVSAGWLVADSTGVSFPHWDRYLSEGSKARALAADRQAAFKDRKGNAEGNAASVTPSLSLSNSLSDSSEGSVRETKPNALPKASRIRGPEAVSVPTAIDTDTFRAKWAEWCEYRAAKKKPVSGHAAGAMLSKLAKFGEATAIKAIEASIENDYQGIFPERESNNGTPQRRDGRRADGTRPGEYAQPDASDIPY